MSNAVDKESRDSGIGLIGNIPWGTHISHLYSSCKDFNEVLAPYIKTGLENNEACVWVYSDNICYEQARAILATSVEDIDTYIEKKQIRIIPHTHWYILDNSFNELRLNRQWLELIKQAVESGFDGLRAVGDTAWLEECYCRDFYQYEESLNFNFPELPFIVLCLYDINKVSIPNVAEIINNHSYTLISDSSQLRLVSNTELLVKERQLTENRRKLNEIINYDMLKTEFFSNVSHELRTPLNVILSSLQMIKLLKDKSDSDTYVQKKDKYLEIIRQNCYRQLRLVNNLIDMTKIDSGYYDLHLQYCNIVEIIENITMSVAEYIESKGIRLVFDTSREEIFTVCDPDQIERILLNLLSNAVKFTDAGGIIHVGMAGGDEKIVISVRDTGTGIPSDKLDFIFGRFQQVDATLSRRHEGSGIGLSLVKSLVEKHNGTIRVDSEVGKGTEFTIELPCSSGPIDKDAFGRDDSYLLNRAEKISIELSDIYL